jgi:GAF domain-containing protein/HAMP domain-containing protein
LARAVLLLLIPFVLFLLAAFGIPVYIIARLTIDELVQNQLKSIAAVKESQIDEWASSRAQNVANFARTPEIIELVKQVVNGQAPTANAARDTLLSRFDNFTENNPDIGSLLLVNVNSGEVIATNDASTFFLGLSLLNEVWFTTARRAELLVPPFYDARFKIGQITVLAATPVVDPHVGPVAVLIGTVREANLQDILGSGQVLGSTGRAYLISQDGYEIGKRVIVDQHPASFAISQTIGFGRNGTATYPNAEGRVVLGAYRWLPRYQVAILVEQDGSEAYESINVFTIVIVSVGAVMLFVSMAGVLFFTRSVTTPLQTLTESALKLASGDLSASVTIKRQDEIGMLATAFNSMAMQLRDLYQGLESKVEARTRQLATAAEVGRAATSILSPEDLLSRTVQLISERFGYYHVSVFLLDEAGAYAQLREASGDIGAQLKKRAYHLAVGSNSLIGWVTANKKPRVALDVSADPLYLPDELLSGTKSEAVLPLRVGDKVIGALDVQHTTLNGFSQADIEVLQILADQIAVAVENGRLFARQERTAQLEQRVAAISAKIHQSLSLDAILENTATELGHLFGARKAVVRLSPETHIEIKPSNSAPPPAPM